MNPLLQWVDSALILAVFGGIVHALVEIGRMNTKIDTMWKWFEKRMEDIG